MPGGGTCAPLHFSLACRVQEPGWEREAAFGGGLIPFPTSLIHGAEWGCSSRRGASVSLGCNHEAVGEAGQCLRVWDWGCCKVR